MNGYLEPEQQPKISYKKQDNKKRDNGTKVVSSRKEGPRTSYL